MIGGAWHCRGQYIALDIAEGLDYLHSNSIIHLDLKSPNVLLTDEYRAKIADVGLAQGITYICTHGYVRFADVI